MNQKEIAEILGLSTRQVRTHTNSGVLVRDENGDYAAKENLIRYTEFEKVVKKYNGSGLNPTEIFLSSYESDEPKETIFDLIDAILYAKVVRLSHFMELFEKAKLKMPEQYTLTTKQAISVFFDTNASIKNIAFIRDSIEPLLRKNERLYRSMLKELIKSIEFLKSDEYIIDTLVAESEERNYRGIIHPDDIQNFESLCKVVN